MVSAIHTDNTTVFIHENGNATHKAYIPLNEDVDIIVGFNPLSSLYDEKNFPLHDDDGKKINNPTAPFKQNIWYVSYPFHGLHGIGEQTEDEKTC